MRRLLLLPWLVLGVLGVSLGLAGSALAAGDASEAGCANEALVGFQVSLPACRAYEMVSPAFKDATRDVLQWVSRDGSRVIGRATGAFAGGESNVLGSYYVSVRSQSGWVTSAIGPPASLFTFNDFFTASADLGRTLWGLHTPAQSIYAEDLYVREADGSFVKVGPMVPPVEAAGPPAGGYPLIVNGVVYAGASADLSHALFQLRGGGALWPGDTTSDSARFTLYEYVGTGNKQPHLVGVDAQGGVISDCGTELGSWTGDKYNAVSASGETLFFTAQGHSDNECNAAVAAPEVSELYARLNGIETVAVSEPSSRQCNTCDETVKMPAEFAGASEDGSKVFFLTEQELLSGDSTMNLYEYDFGNPSGKKVVRVSVGSQAPEVQGVARVSEDGSHVYFVARSVLTEGQNRAGEAPVAGGDNLYVFERDATYPAGHVAFIVTLSEEDSADWRGADVRPVQATPDGRFLVFQSVADLTPGNASSEQQVFEYDALSEELVRVSVGQVGYADGLANADAHGSNIPTQLYRQASSPTGASSNLAVSADGSNVVFNSTGALASGAEGAAAAGAESAYEYRSVGSIANGNVYLISDGVNTLEAPIDGLDASGGDVFFETADPLLAQDVDTQFDTYDARVGGGFPAEVVPAGCEGDACQGALAAAPSVAAPGSVSGSAEGNLAPAAEVKRKAAPKPKPKPKAKAKHKRRAKRRHRKTHSAKRSMVYTKGKR
jgi:hypothetical protein